LIRADVLILGAGPAGAVAALNLAPTRKVVLVDRCAQASLRIGEALPPAARRLLTDMGLFDAFAAEGHSPCYGNRAVWGGEAAAETDFLRDPDGHGWHLDRTRFDNWLRRTAVARGAIMMAPARLVSIHSGEAGWRARLETAQGEEDLTVSFAIEAGGRAAPLARRLGARRRRDDRLICGWVHGRARPTGRGAGLTTVEAVENGWWYTAPLPEGRRVLAFLTDADLQAVRDAHDRARLAECAATTREIGAILDECRFLAIGGGFAAAHSSVLEPCAGERWLAAGDACMSFDPLSAQGLLHALFSGLAAAEAADARLAGDDDVALRYRRLMDGIQRAYRGHLDSCYASETRWPLAPFWQRRLRADAEATSRSPLFVPQGSL
jgi:flavin-dependent dehydrogenase